MWKSGLITALEDVSLPPTFDRNWKGLGSPAVSEGGSKEWRGISYNGGCSSGELLSLCLVRLWRYLATNWLIGGTISFLKLSVLTAREAGHASLGLYHRLSLAEAHRRIGAANSRLLRPWLGAYPELGTGARPCPRSERRSCSAGASEARATRACRLRLRSIGVRAL